VRSELFRLMTSMRLLRSCARLLPIACALGALHCQDGAAVIEQSTNPERPPAPDSSASDPGNSDDADPGGTGVPAGTGGTSGSAPGGNTPGEGTAEGGPSRGQPPQGIPPEGGASNGGGTPGACQPRGSGGPFYLTEGGAIRIGIECGTGLVLPGEQLLPSNLPPNASFDAATRSITFTPGLDQAGVYTLDVAAGPNDTGQIQVQVADRFDAPGNVPVNPLTYTEELGLPVVHLNVDATINDQEYAPATITYRGHTFAGAEAKYRGQTSLGYPKKSFTLKFAKDDRFGDALRVAGFTDKRRVTLTTTFDDNSNVRARLAFELWNRLGADHIQLQTYSAVVYLNGEFWGLYTVTDHVDDNLMKDNGLSEEGNLYKARTHDANFRLTRADDPQLPKESLSEGYTKEEGTPVEGEPGANADLEDFVSWVATSTSDTFLTELGTRLVQREYEDWWLLVSLIIAGDSAGKNSYHYRDPRADATDGRFHVLPWDFNDAFGQTFYNDHAGREADRDPEELAEYNRLFERLLEEPTTRSSLISRYRSVLANEWELGSVLQAFDAWAAENEGVALRDESKWAASYADYFAGARSTPLTTHAEEMAYVRQWIIDRWTFVGQYY
jgi:CotH protein